MKKSNIQVNGLLTAGCARNVEKALTKISGVHHVSANYLNSTATVHYDEGEVSLAELQAAVADCGYICAGEAVPAHMVQAGSMAAPPPPMGHAAHAGHARSSAEHVDHTGHAMVESMADHSAHVHPRPAPLTDGAKMPAAKRRAA